MTLITTTEAARAARITGTPTSDQSLTIAEMVNALTPALERVVGPIELNTVVHTQESWGRQRILLPFAFVSITSVVINNPGGGTTTLAPATYDALTDAARGILREAPLTVAPWAYAVSITITAVVGSASVTPAVKEAAMELFRYWWQLSQQGRSAADGTWTPPVTGLPAVVLSLLSSQWNAGGFA